MRPLLVKPKGSLLAEERKAPRAAALRIWCAQNTLWLW